MSAAMSGIETWNDMLDRLNVFAKEIEKLQEKIRKYKLQNGDFVPADDTSEPMPAAIVPSMPHLYALTFTQLQSENAAWVKKNFPARKHKADPLLGAVEEIGELAHAHLKSNQGIRGDFAEHCDAKVDAVADIIIYLADYCTMESIDLQLAVETTWAKVKCRDWQKDKVSGGE